ncbi:MAG: hypothetical protein OSA95_07930 [Opitutales bacterium]|nr:hypothetical protein [Opitutales bacterium]
MKNKAKRPFVFVILGILSLIPLDASAAVAPHSEEYMEQGSALIVSGEVTSLSSKTQKSKVEMGLLVARDRIYKITIKVASLTKGKTVKVGDELQFQAWRPSIRFPPLPGPQGHQSIPGKGDLIKTYLIYNRFTRIYQPFIPNGINILHEAK